MIRRWLRGLAGGNSEEPREAPRTGSDALPPPRSAVMGPEWQEPHLVEPPGCRSDRCPHCGETLSARPERSRKCPLCRAPIVVRTSPTDKAKLLMTEEQAAAYDESKESVSRFKRALKASEEVGIGRSQLVATLREMAWDGSETPNPIEAFLALSEAAAKRAGLGQDWATYSSIRSLQRLTAYMDGRDTLHYQQEWSVAELLQLRDSGARKVRILTSADDRTCPGCKQAARSSMSIDDAMATLPIPNACTSEEGCRCVWIDARYA